MATKVAKELTPVEVVELVVALANKKGGEVLRVIQDEAKARGVNISLMGATSFRDSELNPFLEKLRNARAKSQALSEALTGGDEAGLLSTARIMLAEKINDLLMADGEMDRKDFAGLAKALSGLTTANTGDRMTVARLKVLEAKEEERQAAKATLEEKRNALVKKGGLSKEAIALMEEHFQLLG